MGCGANVSLCEKGSVGARAKMHKRLWCEDGGSTCVGMQGGGFARGSLHVDGGTWGCTWMCARLSVQKTREHGAAFTIGYAKVLHA